MENKRTESLKSSNSKFNCDLCNKEFSRSYFLQFHKLSHSKPFQCKECGKVFQRSFPYNKHLHIHNPPQKKVNQPKPQKVFHCLTCDRSFNNRSGLVNHQKAFHGQRFLCEVCGTQFLYQGSLDRHHHAHSTQQGSTESTTVEGRKRPECIILPLNIYTGKVFRCEQCSKLYATCSALEKHVRITHRLRTKPFVCKNCGKYFSCPSSLSVHLRIHSRFKPYICKCGCHFARKDLLVTHLQNDHKKFPVE